MSTGVCDDVNNNAYCSWDGGDCCASRKISQPKQQFEYCEACACLDCTDKDFRTCIVSGKRVKCKGASTTTTRLSTRARARTTTTTTSTTTPERTWGKSTSSAPAKVTTSVSRTTATTTTVASQKRDKCVKVAKGACGSKKHKGDGE